MSQPAAASYGSFFPQLRKRLSSWGPWQICWLAFVLRLAVIGICHYYKLKPQEDHFDFGAEMGRVARSLATGHGFSDPFLHPSGPTAWVTPLFPLVLCGIFKLFGVYTKLAAWAILSLDSLLNALMIPLLWEIGERCFGLRVARWSAWIWALYPAAMQYAVKWVWEMTLTTFLLQVALVLALRVGRAGERAGDGPTWKRWLGFGLVWGLLALSNASTVLLLPVCGLWMLSGAGWRRHFPKAFASGLVFFALITPWIWRNERVFHQFVPFRSNFGAELCLGNGPGSTGFLMQYNHPTVSQIEFDHYRQMGELRYCAARGALAKATIAADVPHFLRICLLRIYFFWFGIPSILLGPWGNLGRGLNFGLASVAGLFGLALAFKQRIRGAGLFLAAFLLLPAIYYVIEVHARFRHPLEPLITVLAVYLFQQAEVRWGCTWPVLRKLWPAKQECIQYGAD